MCGSDTVRYPVASVYWLCAARVSFQRTGLPTSLWMHHHTSAVMYLRYRWLEQGSNPYLFCATSHKSSQCHKLDHLRRMPCTAYWLGGRWYAARLSAVQQSVNPVPTRLHPLAIQVLQGGHRVPRCTPACTPPSLQQGTRRSRGTLAPAGSQVFSSSIPRHLLHAAGNALRSGGVPCDCTARVPHTLPISCI